MNSAVNNLTTEGVQVMKAKWMWSLMVVPAVVTLAVCAANAEDKPVRPIAHGQSGRGAPKVIPDQFAQREDKPVKPVGPLPPLTPRVCRMVWSDMVLGALWFIALLYVLCGMYLVRARRRSAT